MKYLNENRTKLTVSLFTAFLGFAAITLGTKIVNIFVRNILVLEPDAIIYKYWQGNEIPMYYKFFIFNWTNPEDFFHPTIKPKFEELGPCIYQYKIQKINVSINPNETITFDQRHSFYYVECLNGLSLDDNITFINPYLLYAAHRVRFAGFWLKRFMSMSITGFYPKVYQVAKVRELHSEGYEDPLARLAYKIPVELFDKKMPKIQKPSYFHDRNGTSYHYGTINMHTSYDKLGQVHHWNHADQLPYATGECAKIRGSAGEFYGPYTGTIQKRIAMLFPDLCRDLHLDYDGVQYVQNIRGLRYRLHSALDNGTQYPEYDCYQTGERVPFGMVNITDCQFKAPGFISLPHFLDADASYADGIDGMVPNQSRHEYVVILEPNSNIPLYFSVKVQANFLVQPISYTVFQKLKQRRFFPLLWVDLTVEIPTEFVKPIKILLLFPLICNVIGATFLIISISISIYLLCHMFIAHRRQQQFIAVRSYECDGEDLPLKR